MDAANENLSYYAMDMSDWWRRLKTIPPKVSANVPAFFGFAVANYTAAIVLSLLPQVGGVVGMVESAGVYGALKVVDHATWDAFNRPVHTS